MAPNSKCFDFMKSMLMESIRKRRIAEARLRVGMAHRRKHSDQIRAKPFFLRMRLVPQKRIVDRK